jgi:hypothetical protein
MFETQLAGQYTGLQGRLGHQQADQVVGQHIHPHC